MTAARHIGSLALVERGQTAVWSSTRVNHRGDPLGGIVVEVDHRVDEETGESVRTYTCLDPLNVRPKVHPLTIAEAEVDMNGVEVAKPGDMVFLIRRMGEQLGKSRSRLLATDETRYCRWIDLLAGVVSGDGLAP